MANSHVLSLEPVETTTRPPHYTRDLEEDRVENANKDKVDAWAGNVTSSFCRDFFHSGSMSMLAGQRLGQAHYFRTGATLKEAVVYAQHSGAGDVSAFRLVKKSGANVNDMHASPNAADGLLLSSSLGDLTIYSITSFGTGSVAAGDFLYVDVETAHAGVGLNAQSGVVVKVFFAPAT